MLYVYGQEPIILLWAMGSMYYMEYCMYCLIIKHITFCLVQEAPLSMAKDHVHEQVKNIIHVVCVHVCKHTCMHACAHTHTHTHTHAHEAILFNESLIGQHYGIISYHACLSEANYSQYQESITVGGVYSRMIYARGQHVLFY